MKKRIVGIVLTVFFLVQVIAPAWAGTNEEAFKEIMSLIKEKYVNKVDTEKLYEGAIKGMLDSLNDPYTVYFDTYAFQNFMQEFESSFSGIGVQIKEDALGAKVVSVFKNSPAQKAGLAVGDIITAVDGKPLAKQNTAYAAGLIRGKAGTSVKLTVRRGVKVLSFVIKRADIENPGVEYRTIGAYGYIKINEFKDNTASETKKALQSFAAKKARGLVLDLRDNPGGELNEALGVLEQLLPQGPMIQIISSEGQKHIISTEGKGYGKPIVVLINGGSASASEIVAGALQDRKAALIIGDKSFGKASVQSIIPLKSSGGLKITVAHYLTPNGRDIHGKGLEPDLYFYQTKNSEKDTILEKAIALLAGKDYKNQPVLINTQTLEITINNTKLLARAGRLSGHYYIPLKEFSEKLGLNVKLANGIYSVKGKQKSMQISRQNIMHFNNNPYLPLSTFLKTWNIKYKNVNNCITFSF